MRRSGLARVARQRVICHTRDDQSIRGVLEAIYKDCVVIAAPEYLGEVQRELPGSAVVPRDNLAWLQVLGGG